MVELSVPDSKIPVQSATFFVGSSLQSALMVLLLCG
jgi:hypothetical protein